MPALKVLRRKRTPSGEWRPSRVLVVSMLLSLATLGGLVAYALTR